MTTFVTGASGHLGANLVRQLVADGQRVRVLVRAGSDNRALDGLDVERVTGDLRNVERLEDLLAGCDRLYHLAAMVSIRNVDRRAMYEANVLATRAVLRAASRVGVRKAVHCSSFSTIGPNPHGPSDESHLVDPFGIETDYERTKLYAEQEVLRAAVEGLDVCIVNPSGLVGPWDQKPSMIGQTILDFAHGRMFAYVPGAHDFVPVRDAARGHVLAMEHGRPGQRYLLTGEVVTIECILDWLAEFTGRPRPRLAVPPELVLRVAGVKDWVERTFFPHRHPRFNQHSIRILREARRADNGRARRELGWTVSPLKEAFGEHVRWFRERGLLPADVRR